MEFTIILLAVAMVFLVLGLRSAKPSSPPPSDRTHHFPPSPVPESTIASTPIKVEIIPAGSHEAAAPPDLFDESRVHQDLQKLSAKSGLLSQTWALHKQRKLREKEIQLVDQYGNFYSSATQMIESKNKLLRARNEYLGMERENEEKNAEKEANIAKFQADAAEHRKRLQDLTNPPAPPQLEPKLTAAQQRLLKKAELEQELQRLKTDEADAVGKTTSETEKKRIQNMYASRRDQLNQQLEKFL